MDFELLLVLATLLCGLIWAVDAAVFSRRRSPAASSEGTQGRDISDPILVEYARSFFPVLLIVLLLRSFAGEPFRIPSESMLPTLEVGDFILVSKYSYGVRLPVTQTRLLDTGSPERGEVAVFRYPRNPSINYIKRIVGLPGDRVMYRDRQLYINGDPVPLERIGDYDPPGGHGIHTRMVKFLETIDNRPHHVILDPRGRGLEGEFVIPAGQYFALGDNRDYSNDSRQWGYVPEENLVGKARMVWMHWNWDNGGIDWSRIGRSIR